MDIEFKSIQELKKRVEPALKTKIKEMKTNHYNYEEEDLWNYLTEYKWKKANNLTLYDIINDILNLTSKDLEEYKLESEEK